MKPLHNYLTGILVLLLLFFSLGMESFPLKFRFRDQYGRELTSTDLKGKTVLLLGCHYRDVALCRRVGRKIYWQLQNHPELDTQKLAYVPYLELTELLETVENYIRSAVTEKYESIYLDREGQLQEGLKEQTAYFRIFSPQGKLVYRMYYRNREEVSLAEILHEIGKNSKSEKKVRGSNSPPL